MSDYACVLCGHQGTDVAVSLVEWREPVGRRRFEDVPRCKDRSACRERVELLGEPWPLAEDAA